MGTLDLKKVKLQRRVREIANLHNKKHLSLVNLKAQSNCDNLITLIERCKKHNQMDVCKRLVDQFEIDPYCEVPDSV